MSEESDDYTYIPPKMDLLSQEQRVKSPWTKLLRKQLALDWEKNIEERRHEFEKEGDEYTVANARAVNHFLPQLRKDLRKRIVELMVNLDKLSVDPLCKEIERTVEQYEYTYDMPKDEAIKQAVKTRKEIIDHNLQPPLDEDPESDYEYENVEDDN
jgi:MinD-like ATPase involved in chromosome partitioning or flagellar assembly